MNTRKKWTLGILATLVLLLFGYIAAGPYLAINGIRNLVAAGNYGELWRFVDFDRLRANLTPQIQAKIAGGIVDRVGQGETATAIGGVTALIAEPAIETIVSPQGIAGLLHGTALARRVVDASQGKMQTRTMDPLRGATTRFESHNRFTATVKNAEGKPVVFEFGRRGLNWKLTGIRLPD